jgi:hypothetical protein
MRDFDSNACRISWRFVSDYIFRGNAEVKTALDKLNTFFAGKMGAGNDPTAIQDAYVLATGSASQFAKNGEFAEVLGSVMAGMISDASYAAKLTALWSWNTGGLGGRSEAGYYSAQIQILSKLVASGNWWRPAPNGVIPEPTISPFVDGEAYLASLTTNEGVWLDARSLTYFHINAGGTTNPTTHTGIAGRWLNRWAAGAAAGRNLVETNSAQRFNLTVDGSGRKSVNVWDHAPIVGVGGSTTACHRVIVKNDTTFSSVWFSNLNTTTHTGEELSYNGATGKFTYKVGNGTTEVSVESPVIAAGVAPGLRCVEVGFEAGTIFIRVNNGTENSQPLGVATMPAGAADIEYGARADGTGQGAGHTFHLAMLKNLRPALVNRNLAATFAASTAGLTI